MTADTPQATDTAPDRPARFSSLGATARGLVIAAAIAAFVAVTAGAFAAGLVGELQRRLADPGSGPVAGAEVLTQLRQTLGYAGFLSDARRLAETAQPAARGAMETRARDARRLADSFLRLSETATPQTRGAALDIVALVGRFERAAETQTPPALAELDQAYLALDGAIAAVERAEAAERAEGLTGILSWAQAAIALALLLPALLAICIGWFLRVRVLSPLDALARSLQDAARGQVSTPVWGTERRDEFGEAARAADGLRAMIAETPDLRAARGDGAVHVTLEGQAAYLVERIAAHLTDKADAMAGASERLAQAVGRANTQIAEHFQRMTETSGTFKTAIAAAQGAVETAAQDLRTTGRALADSGSGAALELSQAARSLTADGETLSRTAQTASTRVNGALDDLLRADAELRALAERTRASAAAMAEMTEAAQPRIDAALAALSGHAASLSARSEAAQLRLDALLEGLSRIEGALASTLRAAGDAVSGPAQSIADSAAALSAAAGDAGGRLATAADDIGRTGRTLGDDAAALRRELGETLAEARAARTALQDLLDAFTGDGGVLSEAAARLETTQLRLAAMADTAGAPALPATPGDTETLIDQLRLLASDVRMAAAEAAADAAREAAPPAEAAELAREVRSLAQSVEALSSRLDPAAPPPWLAAFGHELAARADRIEGEVTRATHETSTLRREVAETAGEVRALAARVEALSPQAPAGGAQGAADDIMRQSRAVEAQARVLIARLETAAASGELRAPDPEDTVAEAEAADVARALDALAAGTPGAAPQTAAPLTAETGGPEPLARPEPIFTTGAAAAAPDDVGARLRAIAAQIQELTSGTAGGAALPESDDEEDEAPRATGTA